MPSLMLALAIGIWLVAVCGVFVLLWKYKSTPGPAVARIGWPTGSRIDRARDRATLIMFAHPYCPCTAASMNQLTQLMSKATGRTRAYVVFSPVVDEDVTTSQLWQKASAIAGVTPLVDRGEVESRAFGASTSGHVVVFDRDGKSLFSGGITSARGHEGDNPGAQRVLALLQGGAADRGDSPIFGCSLNDE